MRSDLRQNLSFSLNISDSEDSGSHNISIMFSEAKNNNRSLSMARKKTPFVDVPLRSVLPSKDYVATGASPTVGRVD